MDNKSPIHSCLGGKLNDIIRKPELVERFIGNLDFNLKKSPEKELEKKNSKIQKIQNIIKK